MLANSDQSDGLHICSSKLFGFISVRASKELVSTADISDEGIYHKLCGQKTKISISGERVGHETGPH